MCPEDNGMAIAMAEPVLPRPSKPAMEYATVEELWGDIKDMFKDRNPIQWMREAEPDDYFQALGGPPEARCALGG